MRGKMYLRWNSLRLKNFNYKRAGQYPQGRAPRITRPSGRDPLLHILIYRWVRLSGDLNLIQRINILLVWKNLNGNHFMKNYGNVDIMTVLSETKRNYLRYENTSSIIH